MAPKAKIQDLTPDDPPDVPALAAPASLGYTYTTGGGEPAGLVERQTDPLGRITEYSYTPSGKVQSVTFALGTAD